MDWLNYHHLFYFWVTSEEGGLAAAARKLRLSHSTIKAQVAQLEASLDTKLFERVGRGLVLTEAGQVAKRYSEEIFGLGAEFLEVMRSNRHSDHRRLRVGLAHVVPKLLVRRLVGPLLADYPDAPIHFAEGPTPSLFDGLGRHELDVVLSDQEARDPRTMNHLVSSSRIVFMARQRPTGEFPCCLNDVPLLLPSQASALRLSLDEWFRHNGIVPRVSLEFDDTALLKAFAQTQDRAFPVPEAIVADVEASTGAKPFGIVDVEARFYVAVPERRMENPLIERLVAQ
ncbi:MAG: LysR substrate-binding domain-containing protein [Myxococcota bacterium]